MRTTGVTSLVAGVVMVGLLTGSTATFVANTFTALAAQILPF